MKTEVIKIPLSKGKIMLSIMACIIFVSIGFWFIVATPKSNHIIFGNKFIMILIGLASILFFGLMGIIATKKIVSKSSGLIIDSNGIIDNSSGTSVGFVSWDDIMQIEKLDVVGQKFLKIIVKNPEEYIKKSKNGLARKTLQINYKKYGSPIQISANTLQISFSDLYETLQLKFNENKAI